MVSARALDRSMTISGRTFFPPSASPKKYDAALFKTGWSVPNKSSLIDLERLSTSPLVNWKGSASILTPGGKFGQYCVVSVSRYRSSSGSWCHGDICSSTPPFTTPLLLLLLLVLLL